MGQLLSCPVCEQRGIRNVLGSIDPQGMFSVVRFRRGEGTLITLFKADNYTVVCSCGFGTTVNAQPAGHVVTISS